MIIIKKEKAYENAVFLKEQYSSNEVLMDSLSLLKVEKLNWKRKAFFLCVELSAAIAIVTQIDTIVLMKNIIEVMITVIIALIAIVFTGYAFFQALINDTLLVTLMSVDIESEGNLYKTNKYFAKVMTFQVFCLVLSLIVVIFLIILPEEWVLFNKALLNELVSIAGITVILHINFEGIWEMKSFIFNVFQLFNLHAYSRLVEMKNREEENFLESDK